MALGSEITAPPSTASSLGLGTAAFKNTGTSAGTVPLNPLPTPSPTVWGTIGGTLADQLDLGIALALCGDMFKATYDSRNVSKISGGTVGSSVGGVLSMVGNDFAAGSITTNAGAGGLGGNISTSGNATNAGGNINTSAGVGDGGDINTNGGAGGGGGNINTSGDLASGGDITTQSVGANGGGSINTRGGAGGVGGNIDTSSGGGSINTFGSGSYEWGIFGNRTTVNGNASQPRIINWPDASGIVALGNGMTADSGWTANADAGDKTAAIPASSTLTGFVAALDLVASGLGSAFVAVAEKVKALETAGTTFKVPNV